MTKIYNVVGIKFGELLDAESGSFEYSENKIEYVQPFGSVTEICKFLKKMYKFPEKDSRKLIITAFGHNTKLWIKVPDGRSVRISQHKVDSEVRLHGNAD